MNDNIDTAKGQPDHKPTDPRYKDGKPKPLRPATRKEKALAKLVATNPKLTQAEAYVMVYGEGKARERSASVNASKVLKRKPVQLELAKYSQEAETVMHEVLGISRERMANERLARAVDWAVNARQTADSILDRVHGKAVQRQQIESKAVVLNIDLTESTEVGASGD